jgi:hypothetical protein
MSRTTTLFTAGFALAFVGLIAACGGTVVVQPESGRSGDLPGVAIDSAATESEASTSVSETESEPARIAFEIAFVNHLEMNLPEQDVYIERNPGSGEVYRVTTGDNDMRAELFGVPEEVAHNPFDPAAVGPHRKGASLGMTLGQWLRHSGTGTYSFEDGVGTLSLEFSGLVPEGVYTMWIAFAPNPPSEPFQGTLDLPLGPRDGSKSVFTADKDGTAKFEHSFRPGLQMSDTWTNTMLAINYHSDGKTYGGRPGEFGKNAHIPLFTVLPNREGLE